jgi:hypothetical protein
MIERSDRHEYGAIVVANEHGTVLQAHLRCAKPSPDGWSE